MTRLDERVCVGMNTNDYTRVSGHRITVVREVQRGIGDDPITRFQCLHKEANRSTVMIGVNECHEKRKIPNLTKVLNE